MLILKCFKIVDTIYQLTNHNNYFIIFCKTEIESNIKKKKKYLFNYLVKLNFHLSGLETWLCVQIEDQFASR